MRCDLELKSHRFCVLVYPMSYKHSSLTPTKAQVAGTFGAASSWCWDVLVPFPAAVFLPEAQQRKEAGIPLSLTDGHWPDGSGRFLFCLVIPFSASVIRTLDSTGQFPVSSWRAVNSLGTVKDWPVKAVCQSTSQPLG